MRRIILLIMTGIMINVLLPCISFAQKSNSTGNEDFTIDTVTDCIKKLDSVYRVPYFKSTCKCACLKCVPRTTDTTWDTLYVHPKTLENVSRSMLSNFTLGYDGSGQNITNGSLKIGGDKTAVSFTAAYFPKNSSRFFFTIKGNANIEENILSISNAGKYNGGWDGELSVVYRKSSSMFYYKKRKYIQKGKELSKEVVKSRRTDYLNNLAIQYARALKNNRDYLSSSAQIDTLKDKLQVLRRNLDSLINKSGLTASSYNAKVDSMTKEIKEKQAILESLSNTYEPVCKTILDSLVAFEESLTKYNPVSFHWLKLSLQYGKTSYNTFDSTMRYFPSKSGTIMFDKKGLTVSYNYFRRSRRYSLHITGGGGYLYSNTFNGVTATSLKNVTSFDSANVSRQSEKEIKVYDLDKKRYEEFNAFRTFGQGQIFFGKGKNVGVDIGMELGINVKEAITVGVWDLHLGFIYSNNNAEDQSTRYSMELLFKASDLTTVVDKERDVFGKKLDVSVRFAVPLSKRFFQ